MFLQWVENHQLVFETAFVWEERGIPKWTDLPRLDAEEILRLAKAFTHREVLDGERIVSQGVVQMGRVVDASEIWRELTS